MEETAYTAAVGRYFRARADHLARALARRFRLGRADQDCVDDVIQNVFVRILQNEGARYAADADGCLQIANPWPGDVPPQTDAFILDVVANAWRDFVRARAARERHARSDGDLTDSAAADAGPAADPPRDLLLALLGRLARCLKGIGHAGQWHETVHRLLGDWPDEVRYDRAVLAAVDALRPGHELPRAPDQRPEWMGVNEGTRKANRHRGLAALRACLEQWGTSWRDLIF